MMPTTTKVAIRWNWFTPPTFTNNNPATPSIPASPSNGYAQTNYTFSTTASDPDGDTLEFRYDWGDGVHIRLGRSLENHPLGFCRHFLH